MPSHNEYKWWHLAGRHCSLQIPRCFQSKTARLSDPEDASSKNKFKIPTGLDRSNETIRDAPVLGLNIRNRSFFRYLLIFSGSSEPQPLSTLFIKPGCAIVLSSFAIWLLNTLQVSLAVLQSHASVNACIMRYVTALWK